MVQVSIEGKLWNNFIIDSRKKGLVASQRIVNFIEKELNKSSNDRIPTKKVGEDGKVR